MTSDTLAPAGATRIGSDGEIEAPTPGEAAPAGGRGRSSWWPSGRTLLAIGIIALGFALPLRELYRHQGSPMEEGFMLVFPQQVLEGDLPNQDFLHLYGPGSLWVLAGAFKAFGTTLATERTVGLVQLAGIVYGVFALALPWGRRVAVACGLIGLLMVIPPVGLAALAWSGGVALGVIGLAVGLPARRAGPRDRAAHRRLVGAGLLGGLALLFRPDLVLAVALGYGALVWGMGWPRIKRVLAGGAVGVAPYLIQFATAGPGRSIQGMVLDPVFKLRGGRTLPLPPTWDGLPDGALQKAGALPDFQPPWPFPAPTHSQQIFLWFVVLPVLSLFTVAVAGWRYRQDRRQGLVRYRTWVLLAGALFGLGMLAQALQRPDTTHLAWVSCVPMAFVPVAIAEILPARVRRLPAGIGLFVPGAAVLAVILILFPFYTARTYVDYTLQSVANEGVRRDSVNRGDRNFWLGEPQVAAGAQELIGDLDRMAQPGQRLLVGPTDLRQTIYSDAYFYYLFPELDPATYYIEMDPGVANAPDSGLAEEVRNSDWLILSNVWNEWNEPNDSQDFGPAEPNQVVRDEFCEVNRYGRFGDGAAFILYRKC